MANDLRWRVACRDAGDGSGDMIVDLPDELLRALGWAEGDTLELEADPDDKAAIRLRKADPDAGGEP